jgi:hypothetical protein
LEPGFLIRGEGAPNSTPDFHPMIMETLSFLKPKYNFKHMKYCGTSTVCKNAIPSSPEEELDPVFRQILKDHPEFRDLHKIAQHRTAQCNPETYGISLTKCDVPCIKPNNKFFDLAKQFTEQMYSFVAGCGATTKVDYGPHTAVGSPQDRMLNPETGKPFQNKAEFLNSTVCTEEMSKYYDEVFKVLNKIEFLPKEDIENKKSRTYFCGNTPLVIRQKLMYDNMDEKMCDNVENFFKCWSRYGFTRQYGGFDRLARAHKKIEERCARLGIDPKYIRYKTADVSGWDRAMSVMKEIYELRAKLFGPMNDKQREIHEYIARNLVEPFCVTYLGEIYQRFAGNCSGSGKTTSDNTIGHTMIEMYCWIKMFYEKNERMPQYEEIIDAVIESLYGDDDLGSFIITEWIDGPDDKLDEMFKEKYISLYQEFGLTIKPSAFKVQNTLEGLEFLGGSLQYNYKQKAYLAVPRVSKVATTLTYLLEGERNLIQYASIIQAAYMLTWSLEDEDCKLIQKYLQYLSRFVLEHDEDHTLSNSDIGFLSSVVLGTKIGDYLVLGRENQIDNNGLRFSETFLQQNKNHSNFFFEFQSRRDRVGFKSEMNSQKFNSNFNYKGKLNELCQKYRLNAPVFNHKCEGPSHNPVFYCSSNFTGKRFEVQGSNKADAEKRLSFVILTHLEFQTQQEIEKERLSRRRDEQLFEETQRHRLDYDNSAHGENWDIYNLDINKIDLNEPMYTEKVSSGLQYIQPVVTPQVDKAQEAMKQMFACMKSYYATPDTHKQWHYYHKFSLLSDVEAAARMAECLKVGSFNPYGNGQQASNVQFTLTKPTLKEIGDIVTCFSTCLLPDAVNIQGSGTNAGEAFDDWTAQINEYINHWSPVVNPNIPELFFLLKHSDPELLPKKYSFIHLLPEKQALEKLIEIFKEGGFNPYGNGQPTPMLSKAQWKKINAPNLKTTDQAVLDRMYARYQRRHARKNQGLKSKQMPEYKTIPATRNVAAIKQIRTVTENRGEVKLSQCAELYALALMYPFAWVDNTNYKFVKTSLDMLPCQPIFPNIKSRKAMYKVAGHAGIDTAGDTCFIAFAPWRLANNGTTTNDTDCPLIYSTSAASPSTPAFPILDTGALLSGAYGTASFSTPYTKAQLIGNSIRYRIVGAALRIRYDGSELNKGGALNIFADPNHFTVSGVTVVVMSQFDTYNSYSIVNITRNDGWITITHTPVNPEDYDYTADQVSNTTWATQVFQNHYIGVLITGLPVGDNVAWEAVIFTEEIGRFVPGKTATPADPVGASIAVNSIKADTQKSTNDNIPLGNLITNGAADMSMTGLIKTAAPVIGKAIDLGAKVLMNTMRG